MDNYRLKLKVGPHEFDAEGPADVVNAQFLAFMQAVTKIPDAPATPAPPDPPAKTAPGVTDENAIRDITADQPPAGTLSALAIDASLDKIMRLDNRIISLTVRPRGIDDAVLLLLYGQRIMRNNDVVTGNELISGLTTTGGLSVGRVDRLLEKAAREGDALVIGERRSKTYRLTNTGLLKARKLASDLLAIVA